MINRNLHAVSIPKINEGSTCEDASIATPKLIAVSDGAGGGGVYAERWSRYLIDNIPDKPIVSFVQFDRWVNSIWEPFYSESEFAAREIGGMFLRKFYEEGSYATLATSWIENNKAYWITYGDSVIFHYVPSQGTLEWTNMTLYSFSNPPHLIGTITPLKEEGYCSGVFFLKSDSVLFAVSDALAHYVMMMYEVEHQELFPIELRSVINSSSKNASFVKAACAINNVQTEKWLAKLINSSRNKANFVRHLVALNHKRLLANDDYSLAFYICGSQ